MKRRLFLESMLAARAAGLLSPFAATTRPAPSLNYAADAPPYSYLKDGVVHGLQVDSLDNQLGTKRGIPLFRRAFPWKRSQAARSFRLSDSTGARKRSLGPDYCGRTIGDIACSPLH